MRKFIAKYTKLLEREKTLKTENLNQAKSSKKAAPYNRLQSYF